jgi:predicted nucleic acid-binding protein
MEETAFPGAHGSESALSAFRLVPFIVTPTATLLEGACRLTIAHQRTVYDSLYLALSLREQ